MPPLQLIFAFSYFFFAQAWNCPDKSLGNGVNGKFPSDADSYPLFPTTCNITIGVPNGQLITLNFAFNNTDGEKYKVFLVYDDTNTYFIQPGATVGVNNWPPNTVQTATTVHVHIWSGSNGTFKFSWTYSPVNPVLSDTNSTITNEQGFLLNLAEMKKSTAAVIKFNSPITIFGDFNMDPNIFDDQVTNSQSILVYAGEGSGGDFLGSLYTIYQLAKPITFFSNGQNSLTVVALVDSFDGGLLFRTMSSIKDLEYSFIWRGKSSATNFTTQLKPTSPRPYVVTIYNYFSQNLWLTQLSNNDASRNGTVDWLPGSYLPPTVATLTWTYQNNVKNVPQLVPGTLNTFVATNWFTLNFVSALQSKPFLNTGDVGYFPSQNYRIPFSLQAEFMLLYVKQDNYIKFTVIDCFNSFEIDGGTGLNLTTGTATISDIDYSLPIGIIYNPKVYGRNEAVLDTGGLLRYEIVSTATPRPQSSNQMCFILLPLFSTFIKLV